jgi:hypothetical protein
MRVLGVHCSRCFERSDDGAVPQYCDCGFEFVACALLRRVSLWLLRDCATLLAIVCG